MWAPGQAQVLTTQNDNARTSANLKEMILTPANVNVRQFGKVFTLYVDGDVYAQPLYLPDVDIPGKGHHNVLFVATEHDSVYAFDADGRTKEPLWHRNLLGSNAGVRTVPAQDVACPFIRPEIGITPTPVIDLPSGTIYVLARTKENPGAFRPTRYVQRLHALAVTTGAEKFGGPVAIDASGFDSLRELPRAGLLLTTGKVYLTWGSSCDVAPYHGWVMAYDARTLAQTAVFNTSPAASESGIWQSDNGPAADEKGNVYVATGNGKFDPGRDFGDTVLKLGLERNGLVVRGSFTPANEAELNARDLDIGSGGPMLTPNGLVVAGGKNGDLYVLDREHMATPRQIFEFRDGIYAAPAYWNGHVYVLASKDYLSDFALKGNELSAKPVATGRQHFGNPGATPAISANGAKDGIVWLIETKAWNGADRPAVLHAYDAANVERELYDTEQNAPRDRVGLTLRFTIPTVVNGRVYVEAKREVDVYGLLGGRE
jgi:outer membrane protein assembly factor BamB